MTTYEEGDGAIVGKHSVRVERPGSPDFDCNCQFATEQDLMELEVVSGGLNDFTLELPLKPKNYKPTAMEIRERQEAREDEEDD